MAEFNPYAPPKADLSVPEAFESKHVELAERGTRLGASILDGLILMLPALSILWLLSYVFHFKFLETVPGLNGLLLAIGGTIIGSLVDLAINGVLLARYGQTVGKKICKIKIIKTTGEVPTLFDSFVKRHFLFTCLQQIPYAGGLIVLIDALFIFRDNRRCLHDLLAGTIVVKLKPSHLQIPNPAFNPAPTASGQVQSSW